MNEPDFGLFALTGADLRDAGIALTDEHASIRWRALAAEAITWCADNLEDFTTDDVWAYLAQSGRDIIETERNPSAIGPAMRRAAIAGLIVKIGATRVSVRPTRHCQELRIWKRIPLTNTRSSCQTRKA
ncbi:hypothetical protein LBMAG38_13810 [Chloroflexota bacterium]|nr:hypothetical protein LBMAG38_13810 [Chloroflexota bacterium]